ncbi:MAG: SDR family NAD(P)-dependent oxidoreductase, partial [Gemmatimonadales bacterium]
EPHSPERDRPAPTVYPSTIHHAVVSGDGAFGWIFTGNGSQWAGMMRGWLRGVPGAREALRRVDEVLFPRLGWSTLDYLDRPASEQEMSRTEVAQPLLFALQVAMTQLLRDAGVRPSLVMGHSVGEVAAAWASGGLALDDACRIIVARSEVAARTAGLGGMAAAGVPAETAERWITHEGLGALVEVAGHNSARSVTLTGDRAALDRLASRAQAEDAFYTVLDLDYPFHSASMDPLERPLMEALEGVEARSGTVPFLSTVAGAPLDPALLIPEYWWHNLRRPVRFAEAVGAAFEMGVTRFLEVGPRGILGHYLRECADEAGIQTAYRATARKGRPELAVWRKALDSAVLAMGPPLVERDFPEPGDVTELPVYPWEATRYRVQPTPEASPRLFSIPEHPLLGTRIQEFPVVWECTMDADLLPWLDDHRVAGSVVFPAAAFLEMALAAAHRVRNPEDGAMPAVERLEIRRPLTFQTGQSRIVRTRVTDLGDRVTVESRVRGARGGWTEHAVAALPPAYLPPEPLPPAPDSADPLSAEHLYRVAEERGLVYGESFQVVTTGSSWRDGAEAGLWASEEEAATGTDGMHLPPPLVDGALQLLLAIMVHRSPGRGGEWAYLPVVIGRCCPAGSAGAPVRARARLTQVGARSVTADFDLLDGEGRPAAFLRGCRFQRIPLPGAREWHENLLKRTEIRLAGAGTAAEGEVDGPVQRRVALLAPAGVDAVGPWTVVGSPEELELVVSHPDPEHLAYLRAELPPLPNLRVQPWDQPLPCDEVHLLGPARFRAGEEVEGGDPISRWSRDATGAPDSEGAHGGGSSRGQWPARRWRVLAGSAEDPGVDALVDELTRRGQEVERVEVSLAVLAEAGGSAADAQDVDGALHLSGEAQVWVLSHGVTGSCSGLELTQAVLTLGQRLHDMRSLHPVELLVLLPSMDAMPEAAAVPALLRVLTNELDGPRFRSVELATSPYASPEADLCAALSHALEAWFDHPYELELRVVPPPEASVAAVRIHRTPDLPPAKDANVQLTIPSPGLLDRLRWEEVPARRLREGQVRIRVHTTGLNFRDVMWALGLIPDELVEDGFAGATMGMECAGEVVEVGPGVTDPAPGDRVMAFAASAFAREVVTDAATVAPIPAHVSFHQAATLPIPFFTAYYALNTLARLREGERVLIHGGAGGVGLAAIQWARHVGAEIFATAGSDEKRTVLREMGVPHVLHSRDLSFVDQVRRITGGEGVDVALNSLAGEAMQATLELLRPFGRFLELGKRDFALNSRLAMRALRNNITYHGIDADQLLAQRPQEARAVFRELVGFFLDGTLVPLPQRIYEADRVEEAFRTMQNARHVGKVVVTMDPPPRHVVPRSSPFRCRPDAGYLVVGGTRGFGLATAGWLADSGARFLVLASRRGQVGPEDAAALDALRARGVRVELLALDATDVGAVEALPGELAGRGIPPLRGVIHAAMVLDDRAATAMDAEAMARVWHPKVTAARNLDRVTRPMALDWMVYYSSATTLFGNPGQANYVASNRALEALAEARSRLGHPTLAVAWGPIGDTGVLARSPEVRDLLARRLGREPLGAKEALRALGELLARGVTGVRFILPMAWKRLRSALPVAGDAAYLWLDGAAARETEEHVGTDFQDLARSLDPGELRALLLEVMVEQVAAVLRLPEAVVDPDRPLDELGMDSLMAVELSVAVERQVGVELPLLSMAGGVTLRQVTERVVERIRAGAGEADPDLERVVAGVRVDEADSALGRHGITFSPEELHQVVDEVEARLREPGGGT